ncbi:DUF3040 domain-containing protein [Nocardiopsis sp. LOL_012]|uniref:DUF3040 domain-containing protein n=1 Tax=Nocardiopsis sp. LOL_012 TaxID=3345409 RepID=UPI003A8C0B89
MSLREHERRILAEIERQLSAEDPDLAGRLEAFGTGDPDAPAEAGLSGWKPWVACALIALATTGLLVLLFVLTPSPPPDPQTGATQTNESVDPAPESGQPATGP